MTAEKERLDGETIKRLDAALAVAREELDRRDREESHRIMCLEAEIRARSAAFEVMKDEFEDQIVSMGEEITKLKWDILGEGLKQAKKEIKKTREIASFGEKPKTGQEEPG